MFINCFGLSAKTFLYLLFKFIRIFRHHFIGLLQTHSYRIISASPGIMQGCLVTSQIYIDIFFIKMLPDFDYIPLIGKGNRFLICFGNFNPLCKLIQVYKDFIYPTLTISCVYCFWIHFGTNRNASCDITGFGLCATHSSKSGSDKKCPIVLFFGDFS